MSSKIAVLVVTVCLYGFYAQAEKDHAHGGHEEERAQTDSKVGNIGHKDHAGDDHNHNENEEGKEHGHEEGEEHEHEEGGSQIGPDKGILNASEDLGIQLSPEAERNFEIKRIKISDLNTTEIQKSFIATTGTEVNIYRYRSGYYKRIDFVEISRSGNRIKIKSTDLKLGDEIVSSGLGFLRIAEIAAFGGAPEGHSH